MKHPVAVRTLKALATAVARPTLLTTVLTVER